VNFSGFYNNLDDLIIKSNIFDPDSKTWQIYSMNKGKMSTLGFEIGVKAALIYNIDLDMSLTYQDTRNVNDELKDIAVGYAPKILGYSKISYLLPINNTFLDEIVLGWVFRYVDSQETEWDNTPTNPNDINSEPIGRIGNKIDSYIVNDLNIRFNKLYYKKITGNFRISNIFDEKFRYPTVKANGWIEKGYPGLGRTFEFSLEYNF